MSNSMEGRNDCGLRAESLKAQTEKTVKTFNYVLAIGSGRKI